MDVLEAIKNRHSVRSYLDKPIESEIGEKLAAEIANCNAESGLNFQLVLNEPVAFDSFMAHYGKFSGVKNYVVFVGKRGADEKVGYYGERVALFAQSLGLNSCWVALTYKKVKGAYKLESGEKVYCVLALGYGETQGVAHKSKTFEQVTANVQNPPEWFKKGVDAALLAPTAMNQQKFTVSLCDEEKNASIKAGVGFYAKIDLGIVKYHFDAASGKNCK